MVELRLRLDPHNSRLFNHHVASGGRMKFLCNLGVNGHRLSLRTHGPVRPSWQCRALCSRKSTCGLFVPETYSAWSQISGTGVHQMG